MWASAAAMSVDEQPPMAMFIEGARCASSEAEEERIDAWRRLVRPRRPGAPSSAAHNQLSRARDRCRVGAAQEYEAYMQERIALVPSAPEG